MTDERRQNLPGRREGRDRRHGYGSDAASHYAGVERRAGERRSGLNRRSLLPR